MYRMRGTPEQLVGSLAERTLDCQSAANLHYMEILKAELSGQSLLDSSPSPLPSCSRRSKNRELSRLHEGQPGQPPPPRCNNGRTRSAISPRNKKPYREAISGRAKESKH
jgi:hypothetical protein